MMTAGHLKILAISLAFLFVSGCAVYVKDDHYRYRYRDRGHRHYHHSSLEPSPQTGDPDFAVKHTVSGRAIGQHSHEE